jgi:hypothetical protein
MIQEDKDKFLSEALELLMMSARILSSQQKKKGFINNHGEGMNDLQAYNNYIYTAGLILEFMKKYKIEIK